MASRYRSICRPASTLFKSISSSSPSPKSTSIPSLFQTTNTTNISRSFCRIGCVQSLLPLHTAVSSARLTSCLGIDSKGSRSLSQEMGLSVPR
ncbi:protein NONRESPONDING TO OXYLIPINS 2, mitochondrial-like isoform X2 [Rutidosis leptorrhynchoides]|uniref:protein NONRESPONDING TO OXYLIPINS 2, mitochondrial-like isoform X2 n=1 Tax=Rutidosis leptorrhynchoides TaxID=125765 RepID=UPI003A99CC81